MDDLQELIDRLEHWQRADTGFDGPTPRHRAIDALRERGPGVVPALAGRLEDLLAATARHHERVAAVQEVWDAWYEEGDRLTDEYGLGADIEPYRTVSSDSLPQQSARDQGYRDPYHLKQGIIEALHHLGDRRAAPVLTAALSDLACVPAAARALRDIHADQPVPALLDAVTLIDHHANKDIVFDPVLAALRHYGVSVGQARERFEAESSPLGRVRLMHLLEELPDDGADRPAKSQIRDSLIFLAMDDRDTMVQSQAIRALGELDNRGMERGSGVSGMDTPPPAAIVRSAIALAAHGNPPGHDRELTSRLRRLAVDTPTVFRAVEAVLTQDFPTPDEKELRLALRLALQVNISTMDADAPMRLIRALYSASSHPQVGDRALFVLRRHDYVLFEQMTQDDDALRAEARAIFEAIAGPGDHARLAQFSAGRRGRWSRLLSRFTRR
ncbi:hypothetical protein [Streptomyces malaysiensis]|uniref:hypothetical protein n=1 Tax=Streptomyces malaysiensis TaxID=92644 RepID=UPI0032205B4F|nr:hypothetical protein [Streptomyces malaysiensis]